MALADQPARRYPATPILEDAVGRMALSRAVHGAILCVESGDVSLSWCGAAGNLQADQRYFIASVTKMYVTVVVLRLRQEGRIDLDDPIGRYLPTALIRGLHVTNGVDRTAELIFDELSLRDMYAFADPEDATPAPMFYKDAPVHVPRYIASITAEGGIVSTAREVMTFLKAFFSGRFFPRETVQELKQWNRIYFPGQFDFGIGLEKQWVPWIMSPLNPIGELLGFWGQSGAFAFHNPQRDLYFTGTVNQLSGFGHGAAVSAMLRIMKAVR